ncbi:Pept-C1 domain-containing protein [Aphelenchoides bicaudatus]|nr:Pept-C1 domain-containing protein [Aphelenchoides bicaudatus]
MPNFPILFFFCLLAHALSQTTPAENDNKEKPMSPEKLAEFLKTNPELWTAKPLDGDQRSRIPHGGDVSDQQTSEELFHSRPENQTHAEYLNFNFAMVPMEFDSRKQWPNCPSIWTVYDQSSCWSCWAVSMAEVASDRLCIQTNGRTQVQLSAIDLTSCCHNCGKGCNEGYPQKAWEYFRREGLVTGGSQVNRAGCKPYPFPECGPRPASGNKWQCLPFRYPTPFCSKSCQPGYQRSYQNDKYYGGMIYNPRSAYEMQIEIMKRGPIQVVFDVYQDFHDYTGGIYYHKSGFIKLFSHVVKLIGWGVQGGIPYWIGVNSWNTGWGEGVRKFLYPGEGGTFRMVRGVNMCGIEKWAVAGAIDTGRTPGSIGGALSGALSGVLGGNKGFSIGDLFKGKGRSKKGGLSRNISSIYLPHCFGAFICLLIEIMEFMSDDEDEPMEVDEYFSNDEELMTDDEAEISRFFKPSDIQKLKVTQGDVSCLATQFGDACLEDIIKLDKAQYNSQDFPEQYRFLLGLPSINNLELKNHPELYHLVFNNQTTIDLIIKKEIAIICLYWAQAINNCRSPLLVNVLLNFDSLKEYKGKSDPAKTFGRILFNVQFPPQNCSRHRAIKRGLVVFVKGEREDQRFIARVYKVESNSCKLSVRCPSERFTQILEYDNKVVDVYELPAEFIPVSMLNSIEGMKSGYLNQIIVPNPVFQESYASYLKRKDAEMNAFVRKYNISPILTPSQLDAVFAICKKEHRNCPFVLYGPPGTGKTFTISQAVQTLLKMKSTNRILICTPSNMAADRVAIQLMEDFGDILNKNNVLRLRSTGNNYFLRDRHFDEISLLDDTELFVIPNNFDPWRVVICTLGCSSHIVNKCEMKGFFSHIVIDEAGQTSEAEMWIPIGGLADPNTSIVLCGDPKQLGPVVTLDISKHLQEKFTSPLVRYMDMRHYQMDKRLCCKLVDCFRCPRVLVEIVSMLFYNGELRHTARKRDLFDYTGLEMTKEVPILFVSVNGREQRERNGFSFCNEAEAQICIDYIKFLIDKKNVSPEQIGVISPYTYQSRTITEALRKQRIRDSDDLTVNSVERFQGSERDIILMTATRTASLGFMADNLRVNTSLTRAKKMLIVIGNERALSAHFSWKQFIGYCKHIGAFKQWNSSKDPNFGIYDDLQFIDEIGRMNLN